MIGRGAACFRGCAAPSDPSCSPGLTAPHRPGVLQAERLRKVQSDADELT
jgi:hypothetical protein